MLKKIFFIFIFFLLGLPVQAAAAGNVSGFAWSNMYRAVGDPLGPHDPSIGWISFNSTNCDTDGNGQSNGGAGCPVSGTVIANYGVNINSNGNFSGYAWSENIGWIDFAPVGSYPDLPNYSAKVDSATGQVSGWARALANGGGWDGWIKLRGTNYGVSINKSTGKISGYAWSDMVIGWISFSGSNYGAVTTQSFNSPPSAPSYVGAGEIWSHCSSQGKSVPTLNWIYSDPDSDPQAAYEVEVDDTNLFTVPKFNHLVNLTATSYVLNLSQDDNADWIPYPYQLAWNTTYFWRARVKDNQGNWSEWSSPDSFQTPNHAYPYPNFTWLPAGPTQGETVTFNPDSSTVYGGAVISSYLWSVTQGTGNFVGGTNANSPYPKIQFSTSNNKVRLGITDNTPGGGYFCNGSGPGHGEEDITAELPLPEYKEVPPSSWLKRIFALFTFFKKSATLGVVD